MKTKLFCVYASTLVDSVGRTFATGDGVTSSSCRIYGIFDTKQEAEQHKEKLEQSRSMTRARITGDNALYPELDVCEFDPLDFVGRQNRDEYTGKRLSNLINSLYIDAEKNSEALQ